VNNMEPEYSYTSATESELNNLLIGAEDGISMPWPAYRAAPRLPTGSTGVLWKRGERVGDPVWPLALVVHEEDLRRLCGRFAKLRSDLSPLTAWCHLLTPALFERLRSVLVEPDLEGLEAAWAGLVVAEAQLVSEQPLNSLRIPSCLATQSFAMGRAGALWHDSSNSEIENRFDSANRLLKTYGAGQRGEARRGRVRAALKPIWASLKYLSLGETAVVESDLHSIIASLRRLQEARRARQPGEAELFSEPLLETVPEARAFSRLSDLTPEQRLRVFDQLIEILNSVDSYSPSSRRSGLALLAGYLATVAAGGTPTLSLAESSATRWPDITAWAYVVGGIGERVVWTSSFDGLGRLVARELMRPFRVDEPPMCDLSLDEASVLVDPKLRDPLVHLRIKQSEFMTISLLPGVNAVVSIADSPVQEAKRSPVQAPRPPEAPRIGRDIGSALAEAVWPYLRARVEEYMISVLDEGDRSPGEGQSGSRRRPGSQAHLPLRTSRK
jgi:hypothetical protein